MNSCGSEANELRKVALRCDWVSDWVRVAICVDAISVGVRFFYNLAVGRTSSSIRASSFEVS